MSNPKKSSKIKIAIASVLVAVLALGGGASYYYVQQNTRPVVDDAYTDINVHNAQADALFRKYLVGLIASSNLSLEDSLADAMGSSDASTINGKSIYSVTDKSFAGSEDLDCNIRYGDAQVALRVTAQTEDATTYLRLNNADGQLQVNGEFVDLNELFSKVTGNWYKLDEDNQALNAQTAKGIFVLPSGIIAPGYDSERIADVLIKNKVYDYTFRMRDGEKYVYDIKTNKANYVMALKQAFPDLKLADKIVDSIMPGDIAESVNVLSVDRDGKFISQQRTQDDICTSIGILILGQGAEGVSGVLNETETVKPEGSITIVPIKDSKPLTDLTT